jgi:serine/threonine-protein kinase
MSLGPGRRLGPYEVLSPLGAGGMGEVWRARDTRLGREVALKVLPDDLVGSAERRSRFDQEARLLAALNHPSIAALFDVLEFEGAPVLVMEVVEGETLAERISRGAIPLKSALELALSIAEALEAAHERGILHRDLKPSNVKLTPGGGIKILDFGLAKALEGNESAVTLPKPAERTGTGVAIGTAPYMSPEQARGEPVNKKTDVWAFGCVLYEMLTGRKAFPGATWSDTIAGVAEREPDWSCLPAGTPHGLQRLLKRCLQKDQKERLRDFADTKLELKDLLADSSAAVTTAAGRVPRPGWKTLLGVIAVLVAFGALIVRERPLPPSAGLRQPRFQLTLPRGVDFDLTVYSTLAISPDGSRMAFVGCGGSCQLYLRELSEIDARPLPGTEGANSPFFSTDGRWMGFAAQGKLKKIDLEHDTVVTLAEARSLRGASWGEDGTIFFATGNSGLLRVSADGGEVEAVTTPEPGEYDHRWPQILPEGRGVLFEVIQQHAAFSTPGSRGHNVAILDLEDGEKRTLVESAVCPKYALSGHILFGRDGVVYAAPFDRERFELLRPPSPVLEDVAMGSSPSKSPNLSGIVAYDLSRDGTLLYSPLEARLPKRTLVTFDRKGVREALSPLQLAYDNLLYSPGGTRIAVTVRSDTSVWDAFVLDMRSGAWRRVNVREEVSTSGRFEQSYQVTAWMPDGERILLSVDLGMLLVTVDGGEPHERFPFVAAGNASVSPDGSAFLAATQPRPQEWDLWRVALTGENAAEPWLATPSREDNPIFSPDGRWVAYESNDSGQMEIYVRPYRGSAVRHQVSTGGGYRGRWSRDGRELFFLSRRSLWSASVDTSSGFDAEPPQKLFDLPEDIEGTYYDVSPDSQKFVMVQRDPLEMRPLDLVVVPGWVEEMKARLAAAK